MPQLRVGCIRVKVFSRGCTGAFDCQFPDIINATAQPWQDITNNVLGITAGLCPTVPLR